MLRKILLGPGLGGDVSPPSFAPNAPSQEPLQDFLLRTAHLCEVSAHILKPVSHTAGPGHTHRPTASHRLHARAIQAARCGGASA